MSSLLFIVKKVQFAFGRFHLCPAGSTNQPTPTPGSNLSKIICIPTYFLCPAISFLLWSVDACLCFSVLAIVVNFSTRVCCYFHFSVVFPLSRICCCFPRLSVTVAGCSGKEEGGGARMGQSESSCPPGQLTQAPTLRWTHRVIMWKWSFRILTILRELFIGSSGKQTPWGCSDHLKVKLSIYTTICQTNLVSHKV